MLLPLQSRKLLATTRPDFEKLVRTGLQTAKTLVVLEVTRTRSAPLLELATAGPLYISATPGIAKADVEEFFGARCVRANQDDLQEIVKAQEEEEGDEYAFPVKKHEPRLVREDADAAAAAGPATDGEPGAEQVGVGRCRARRRCQRSNLKSVHCHPVFLQPAEGAEQPLVPAEVLPEAGEGHGVGQEIGPEGEILVEAMAADVPVEDLLSGAGAGDAGDALSAVAGAGDAVVAAEE